MVRLSAAECNVALKNKKPLEMSFVYIEVELIQTLFVVNSDSSANRLLRAKSLMVIT